MIASSAPRQFSRIWSDLEMVLHELRRAKDQHEKTKLLAAMRRLIEEADRVVKISQS